MGARDGGRLPHPTPPRLPALCHWLLRFLCFHIVTFKFVLHILVPISQACACMPAQPWRLHTWTEGLAHVRQEKLAGTSAGGQALWTSACVSRASSTRP